MDPSDHQPVALMPDAQVECGGDVITMMPVPPSEDTFEEMTVEVDIHEIKGSPLEQDSTSGTICDDDSQQSLKSVQIRESALGKENFHSIPTSKVNSTYGDEVSTKESNDSQAFNCKPRGGKNVFMCEVCSKSFEKRSRLLSHMLSHSNEKDHICDVCKKGFKNKSQLQRHSNTHSDTPRFCCNICGRGFKHNDVAKHIRRFHSGPRKSARGGVANPNAHAQFSGLQTSTLRPPQHTQSVAASQQQSPNLQQENEDLMQLQLVKGEREQEIKFRFQIENQIINQQHQVHQELMIHQIETAGPERNSSQHGDLNGSNLFPCSKCSKSFSKRSGLVSHMVVHEDVHRDSNKAKHQCHICLKTFTRSSGLNTHLQLHLRTEKRRDPNPDFRCHLCGKMFTRRTGLNAHVLQHGGVFRFWCDEPDCGKGFVHSYQMTRHKRSHSDVMPYTCDVCGKSFRHNDLSKHMRIHTGVKPYCCQHCGKAFAFSSSVRAHERMHLAVREHLCEVCSAGFPTSAGLRRHLKSHEDEKEESCFHEKQYPKLHLSLPIQDDQHCVHQTQISHVQQVQQQVHQQHVEQQVQQLHVQQQVEQQVHVQQQVEHQVQHQLQQVQVQHQLQQVQVEHVQQLPQVHEVQVEVIPSVTQHAHPIALHVAHDTDSLHLSSHQDQETTLATLTAHPSDHLSVQLPVSGGTEQATVSSPANIGALPVLVPFSVSVPISVPFGISLNGTTSEQIHLNQFLSWEQKY